MYWTAFAASVMASGFLIVYAQRMQADVRTLKYLVDQVAYVVFVAHIGAYELRFRACLTDFTDELLAFFVVPTSKNNPSAIPGESEGCRSPDACQCSCNQNDLGIH
jgi:hypothetical protein